ncbi:MAG: dTDP-4-dehydrorhamnose 3,5-epimerase [Candidatus Scalindua sp. AMX11]|nr:MAG: dTDP-4-dehydrorhamnose 3,5-epimerase [Candidatus Scalindua sp.]NOG83951.1 dTDP-4-dehydrorhamnose 3,5-epimerase [Planctomycetota bacterium]RZV88023.1 MAG: dTDP-4-dehydrorhamnose 3,5-epimerase [Candidatus Scalindua sp. SCAELEC01]TDE63146.1 MAG: dTDP-4-dehydrorhamnose 3,5-epimerase [Candidatus Scalindua sp. AMX11]GJQ58399.1 MAG: dTDP-4-dehydrorhamnose 3,5-epimerase [Candidatus Scalindua sp.]
MSLKIQETSLPGVLLIEPKVFKDSRGFFMETFHKGKYEEGGIDQDFVQDNYSHSSSGTLRGLHYQLKHPQGKLVYVITGEIFDVAVDIRYGSPTFGQWGGFTLSSENRRQVYIPEGFAHGFCVLSESADVLYKCTDVYKPDDEYGIMWSDQTMSIEWPVIKPNVSDKDRQYSELREIPSHHLPLFT